MMKGIIKVIGLISVVTAVSIASAQTTGGMIPWEFEGYTVRFTLNRRTSLSSPIYFHSSPPSLAGRIGLGCGSEELIPIPFGSMNSTMPTLIDL